jgi:hypothetical protein
VVRLPGGVVRWPRPPPPPPPPREEWPPRLLSLLPAIKNTSVGFVKTKKGVKRCHLFYNAKGGTVVSAGFYVNNEPGTVDGSAAYPVMLSNEHPKLLTISRAGVP